MAIDDVQWLDPSSQAVLAAGARRFTGRVGLLITERTEHEGAGAATWLQLVRPDGMAHMHVGPLSLGGLHALISARLGRSFPRPTMVRIAEISGGNPFYALELARAIEAGSSQSVLPATLAELMRQRIGRLDGETQDLLLAAACAATPTVDLVARVTGNTVERVAELLEAAKGKGIIGLDGDVIRFAHPLLARSVYTDAKPSARRAMHRSLSETVMLPELRARHMALAASSADPTTLRALDAAAGAAHGRGAPVAAAELVELAIGLGGDTPARRIRAAEHHLHGGDLQHAQKLLDRVDRCRAAGRASRDGAELVGGHADSTARASRRPWNCSRRRSPTPRTTARCGFALCCCCPSHELNAGDFVHAMQNAERAVAHAEDVDNPDLTSQVLSMRAMVACMCGRGIDEASLRRAVALEDPDSDAPIALRASANNALLLAWAGRLDEAGERMSAVRRRCMDRGAETDLHLRGGASPR